MNQIGIDNHAEGYRCFWYAHILVTHDDKSKPTIWQFLQRKSVLTVAVFATSNAPSCDLPLLLHTILLFTTNYSRKKLYS